MKGYKTSTDYTHLKELVESGQDVVCFVTWDFDKRNKDPNHEPWWVTDVCYCRYFPNQNKDYVRYSFSSRGMIFDDYWPSMDEGKYTFEDCCKANKIEFIEPNEKEFPTDEEESKFWEQCNKCRFFDGYDKCLRKDNFGAVTDEHKDKCVKNKLFSEK